MTYACIRKSHNRTHCRLLWSSPLDTAIVPRSLTVPPTPNKGTVTGKLVHSPSLLPILFPALPRHGCQYKKHHIGLMEIMPEKRRGMKRKVRRPGMSSFESFCPSCSKDCPHHISFLVSSPRSLPTTEGEVGVWKKVGHWKARKND